MRRKFTYTYSLNLLIAAAIWSSFAFTVNIPIAKRDTTPSFLISKKAKKKSLLPFNLPFIGKSSSAASPIKVNSTVRNDDKLISSVEIFPNPIVDQITLKYNISRNTNVSIKMMDILGNEVATLCSQRVEPGERSCSYYLSNKITKGFYFIRVVAGTESVIKRISIL